MIVNRSNKINTLEMPQLAAIFSGQITDWAEVGGEPGAIGVYARDDNSGTYDTFKHIVLDKLKLKEGSRRFESNPELSEQISRDPLGIGFTSLPNINKKKARTRFFGKTITPFGPRWLDRTLASLLRLKGDLIPDFRLIDYLVTLLSTETSPALNGMLGNHERLKEELAEMGIFDPRMAMYLPYRQRLFATAGYAGFEGRSYSLFHNLREDMAEAVDMQNLVTALACRYIILGKIDHHDIPDRPSIESERRQIFFGSAIGIPTFYVRADTSNRLLKKIVTGVNNELAGKTPFQVSADEFNTAMERYYRTELKTSLLRESYKEPHLSHVAHHLSPSVHRPEQPADRHRKADRRPVCALSLQRNPRKRAGHVPGADLGQDLPAARLLPLRPAEQRQTKRQLPVRRDRRGLA